MAGHELGHSVWRGTEISTDLDAKLQGVLSKKYLDNWGDFQKIFGKHKPSDLSKDLIVLSIWRDSYHLALRQCEELFCDILGMRLFSEGYLYSFVYMLCPALGDRAPNYPPIKTRSKALRNAADKFKFKIPDDFEGLFYETDKTRSTAERFINQMADLAAEELIAEITELVRSFCEEREIAVPTAEGRDRVFQKFLSLSPADGVECMADVINAGWAIRLNFDVWDKHRVEKSAYLAVLNDLVFKTIEVMEYDRKIARN